MIAAEKKSVSRAAADCAHAAAVGVDACRVRIAESASVHRSPEVRVELEVGAAPFLAHRPEHALEVRLRLGMGAVDRVPRTVPPSAERHAIGSQRRAGGICDEPGGMLTKYERLFFSDERRDPDGRLESAAANVCKNSANASAKGRAGLEPIAHRTLIAVSD